MSNWLNYQFKPGRFRTVLGDITRGSEPAGRFYILAAVSTMIASFGLVTSSTAVIIGAMIVAPLMTHIFGIAQGLVCGDATLLGKAIRAEIADMVLRDYLTDWIGFDLLDVGLLNLPGGPVAMATFTGFTPRQAKIKCP